MKGELDVVRLKRDLGFDGPCEPGRARTPVRCPECRGVVMVNDCQDPDEVVGEHVHARA